MIKVNQKQRDNALYFLKMWATVPPELVADHLSIWYERPPAKGEHTAEELISCNTPACGGGWAAVDPYFIAQGLVFNCPKGMHVDFDLLPEELKPIAGKLGARNPDGILFGCDLMFNERAGGPEYCERCGDDGDGGELPETMHLTDHELVKWRFDWLIENSTVTKD